MASTDTEPKYVFDKLVRNKNDALQLLSYALYCAAKNGMAHKWHKEGRTQLEIDANLKAYHQTIAQDSDVQLLFHESAKKLHAEYTQSVRAKAISEFVEKIQVNQVSKESTWQWAKTKLWDAVAGVAASVVVIVLCVGLASLFAGKEKRDAILEAGAEEAKDMVNGNLPVIDKYRDIMAKKHSSKEHQANVEQATLK